MNAIDVTAAIQYVLTAAQSLGSRVYYKQSRMTILGLLMYYSVKTNRHRQNGLSYLSKKILTWMLREARGGGLKETVGNRVKPDYHFIRIVFCSFVSFSLILAFPGRLCSKACQHILNIVGLSQDEV